MAQPKIESWTDVSLTDLFYAFRKAKADCYFERSLFVAREFVEYESSLPERLAGLLERLQAGQIVDVLMENLGEPRLVAKKLSAKPKTDKKIPNGHGFFSNPDRAFRHLCDTHELTPEFRLVGDFPVEMHVLSALWINRVGHKFDAALTKSAYGSRLRRYRPEPGSPEGTLGTYHTEAIGSFQPYFAPYRQWRERGLRAIREELEAERSVIAITMDLTSYYHRVDPAFMKDARFLDYAGIGLDPWEREFTTAFADALAAWSDKALEKLNDLGCKPGKKSTPLIGGLPIGLSISRVVSNALLVGLDREIEQQLSPVYYGRYVDDIFIVLHDPGDVVNFPQLQAFIAKRTMCFPKKTQEEIYLKLPGGYQGKTSLLLQQSKQKVFFLEGQGGIDLLDSIESQIRSVSSERRLMPNPDKLESMAAAKVLAAAGQASEEADTLRRADGLSVRRLGWSVLLRAVETLSRDLRRDDWKAERSKFYKFALSHILRPDKIFDHLDYLPRLLSLAVALKDWADAKRLFDAAIASLTEVEKATEKRCIRINGHDSAPDKILWGEWEAVRDGVRKSAADAISRSLRWGKSEGGMQPLPEVALKLCAAAGLDGTEEDLEAVSLAIREADWAKTSYKDHLRRDATRQRPSVSDEELLASCYDRRDDLSDFLGKTAAIDDLSTYRVHPRAATAKPEADRPSQLPYLFPTRPYSTEEVSLFLPNDCVFVGKGSDKKTPARNWARYVRALRGVWVWESLLEPTTVEPNDTNPDDIKLAILDGASHKQILLGISSLLTSDDTWKDAASGRSDLSRARYKRIEDVVNQAIKTSPRPTHLLLPELSLPERWLGTVTGLLRDSGISLIAGLDYHVAKSTIHSEAVLVLADDRLGFPAFVRIHQPKTEPAPGEDFLLQRDFGKHWTAFPAARSAKPVYLHKDFAFGVLVCSELQNVQHRLNFQGAVDCMMVLSWNQDLETFSALVESASLDVHAYVALVNNRRFGDSRVRVPEKTNHKRDVCRLRGGENEHVVVVKLDAKKLREFQSRANRWPDDGDPFKPVPEGFRIRAYRAATPS
ncbi:MAG TPA: RNA-directed DNA polymerase [Halothiobacillus sp.]|nr:RNA-directed DNA polymerase [Halothiobacillus sp.]